MDFNRIKEMGLEYAEKGKNAALDLAEKGKTQALIVNEQGKLLKAQRQLGALVYSLKASLTPAEAAEVDYVVHEEKPAAEPEAPAAEAAPAEHKSCPQCGAPVSDDALFCNKCGAQL